MGHKDGSKEGFLDFLVRTGALRFGDFRLKSGRRSPYMVDTGRISSGNDARRIGEYFAKTIKNPTASSLRGMEYESTNEGGGVFGVHFGIASSLRGMNPK